MAKLNSMERAGAADDPSKDGGADDGFSHESGSAPGFLDDIPNDTTAAASASAEDDAEAVAAAAPAEGDEDEAAEAAEAAAAAAIAEGQTSRSEMSRGTKPTPGGKKVKETAAQRKARIQHEIDQVTWARAEAQRELDETLARLASAKAAPSGQPAAAAGMPATAKGTTTAGAPAGDSAAAPALPKMPDYRKFESDEDYAAAVEQYNTDLTAYLAAQTTAAVERVSKTVDERFTGRDAEARQAEVASRMVATLDTVRSSKADWNERAQNLAPLRSGWYSPAHHDTKGPGGERIANPTPAITHLSRSLLMAGKAEGAELLYNLGDPAQADRAQAIADLPIPRHVCDAMVHVPSVQKVLDYFVTPEGAKELTAINRMQPDAAKVAVGALGMRLDAASVRRGTAPAAHSITKATPARRPLAGGPGAHTASRTDTPPPLDQWWEDEDRKDEMKRRERAGLPPVPAAV
jgi:hypothetical protein